MRKLKIEPPALLIYSDGEIKIVNSVDELHKDVDWVFINYEDNEFLIDSNLHCYRFTQNNRLESLVLGSDILYPYCDEMNKIVNILERGIEHGDLNDDELSTAKDIVWKIKSRNN